jgi:uncharacterized protein YjbI with pentapeptide repeats
MTTYKQLDHSPELIQIFLDHMEWLRLVKEKKGQLTSEELTLRGNLEGADLSGYELKLVDMSYMNLQDAHFNDCRFIACNLYGVNASNANFYNTQFYQTKMRNACFYDADFTKASVNQGQLNHSFFLKSNFKGSTFTDVDALGAFLVRTETGDMVMSNSRLWYAHTELDSPFKNTNPSTVH